MARTDANPPLPEFRSDYVLYEVDAAWLSQAVKPKQFIHIDQSECIMCEGCVDICPWKCIHMVATEATIAWPHVSGVPTGRRLRAMVNGTASTTMPRRMETTKATTASTSSEGNPSLVNVCTTVAG